MTVKRVLGVHGTAVASAPRCDRTSTTRVSLAMLFFPKIGVDLNLGIPTIRPHWTTGCRTVALPLLLSCGA